LTSAERLDSAGNEALRFLTPETARAVAAEYGSPAYVYDMATLRTQANAALAFPHPFGLTVRYAMKSAPNAAILRLFHSMGLHIDASSGFEVRRAMAAGFAPEQISLSTQELPDFFMELLGQVRVNLHLPLCC
jgi:diaminopimelate decarboxylase